MATITISPSIHKGYLRQDGTYVVRIRIYYKGKNRYLTTNITATPSQLRKDLTVKDYTLRQRIDALMEEMRQKANDIVPKDNMTVDDVVKMVTAPSKATFRLDFPSYGRKVALEKKEKNTIRFYLFAVSTICKYLGAESFDISVITTSFLNRYYKWLVETYGERGRSVSACIKGLSYIHKMARMEFNDYDIDNILIKNPFESFHPVFKNNPKHRVISEDAIREMYAERNDLPKPERFGVRMFLLSFVLMGMNAVDLMNCNIEGNIVHYFRKKTAGRRDDRAEMRVRMEKEFSDIFDCFLDGDKFLITQKDAVQVSAAINNSLKRYAARKGMDGFTMYYARHSWATYAYRYGMSKSLVNDGLCHIDPDMKITDIYVQKDWGMLWDANRAFLLKFFGI